VVVLSASWSEFARSLTVTGKDARLHVVPNAVRIPATRTHGSTPPRVFYSGRLENEKGTDILLDAISTLQARGVDADWVLAGEHDMKRWPRVVSSLPEPERVELTGWLEEREVHGILEGTDVFVLPSRAEGLPISVLEAMSYGVPSVATALGGIPELISDGVNGVLVPPGDARRLADALEELILDPARRARLGKSARASVVEGYSLDRVVGLMQKIYREVERVEPE
jgi:glycosyltransferase involved in cell wall biosynthesis